MFTLVLIGFIGGLITGISPCILPVLPVIFFSSTPATSDRPVAGTTVVATRSAVSQRARPYFVIAGLVTSFSVVTLAGSALLSLVGLPQGALRWAALAALVAVGVGLIFPSVQHLLERPFARLPQHRFGSGRSGFGFGLALGVLYVPCAGPVLAAIIVAGATGEIGPRIVALTLAFAVGAALPLLMFALAGRRLSERVAAFRRRQREVRIAAGVVTIGLAVALVFDLPATLQRLVPDYTGTLQEEVAGDRVRQELNLGGLVNEQNAELSNCSQGATELERCGTAPDIRGISGWINTPDDAPVDLRSLRGKVVLVDFWAYSCINCQRSIPHLVGWYDTYRDAGFEVIGVHTPEYAFERDRANVVSGTRKLGIDYPVAMDNGFATWTNYRNRYWPAHYLIDRDGVVRHVKFGEGDYGVTERLIRELLDADGGSDLPPAIEVADNTPTGPTTPETYFSVGKVVNYGGAGRYDEGSQQFALPAQLPPDTFALRGPWLLDYQGITAEGPGAGIALDYRARQVYLVVGGTGTVTTVHDGRRETRQVSGPPDTVALVGDDSDGRGRLDIELSPGLQAYSLTYG